jgi:TPR repeat protein
VCYGEGKGIEKDGGITVKWMQRAVEHGDPAIDANLAEYMMEDLRGAPKWNEALRLFQSSLNRFAPSKTTSAWLL